jgi:oligopeptide transport system substrate-binding protein
MELMRQAERIALADEAWAPIYFYVSKNLVSPKLEGWVSNPRKVHRARWMALKQ